MIVADAVPDRARMRQYTCVIDGRRQMEMVFLSRGAAYIGEKKGRNEEGRPSLLLLLSVLFPTSFDMLIIMYLDAVGGRIGRISEATTGTASFFSFV